MAPQDKEYGKLSWTEYLGLAASFIPLPAVVLWNVATTAFAPWNKDRELKRVISDCALRYCFTNLSARQLQGAFGTTLSMYEKWTKANKLPNTIDELDDDARLLWIGPKRLERVVLILHGGAYFMPATDFCVKFWRYVQLELEKHDIKVGFVLLNYSLAPYSVFPTPLKQAGIALNFLLAAGVKPHNLQLVGDSAGGNLILQILSQMLHPLPSVPQISLPGPLRGVFLISPWTRLSGSDTSFDENAHRDIAHPHVLSAFGGEILKDVPTEHLAFAEPVSASQGWFAGVDRCVERVLVTAGGVEILRDSIVAVGENVKQHHKDTELVVQPNGLHEDMILDFVLGTKKLSSLTPLTLEWLAAGFSDPIRGS